MRSSQAAEGGAYENAVARKGSDALRADPLIFFFRSQNLSVLRALRALRG